MKPEKAVPQNCPNRRNNTDICNSVRSQAGWRTSVSVWFWRKNNDAENIRYFAHTDGYRVQFPAKKFLSIRPILSYYHTFLPSANFLVFLLGISHLAHWHTRTPDGPVGVTHNIQTSSTTANKTWCYLTQERWLFNANILSFSVFKFSFSSPSPLLSRCSRPLQQFAIFINHSDHLTTSAAPPSRPPSTYRPASRQVMNEWDWRSAAGCLPAGVCSNVHILHRY